ncbi:unnamed protein product [Prunus armeniaca]
MDKSWMHADRRSKAYELGVEGFLNFAVENLGNKTHIHCPCVKCGNIRLFEDGIIRDPLYFNGIDQSYKIRTWHGEPWEWTTTASRNGEEDEQNRFSFVFEELGTDDNDLGNIGSDPSEFANVIGDGDQPLYPSCNKYTKLSALVKLYNLKAKHEMSDVEGKDSILKKGVPAKVVWYFSPIPRFKRMFQSRKTANSLIWHADRKSVDGYMSHPANSPSWKLVDDEGPEFGK